MNFKKARIKNLIVELKAVQKAGVEIPHIKLSKNNNFLLVERFNYNKQTEEYLGFEEVLVLQGKNKDEKYSGSYESVAKVIYAVSTHKQACMTRLFKIIVMNYLLKNGDAHLKNFAIIYNQDITDIRLSPAYDIVNSSVYLYKDRPALTLFGQKIWFAKKDLIKFGIKHCFLSKTQASQCYEQCIAALKSSIEELELYLKTDKKFASVGTKMLDSWNYSLQQIKHKELPVEIIRHWK